MKSDFPFFITQVFGFLKDNGVKFYTTPSYFRRWIDIFLDDTKKRVLIVAFRDSAKTTFWSFLVPTFYAIRDDRQMIMLIGCSQDQSVLNLSNIKELIETFPPLQDMKGKKWSETHIKLSNGSQIIAKGFGSNIRGAKNLKERPSLIICDDVIPDKPTMPVPWYIEFFHSAITPALSTDGRLIVVGTPFNPSDLIFDLSNRDDYEKMRIPIWDDNKNPAWEDKFPRNKIEEMKRNTPPITWARNYAVMPIVEEGITFAPEWLRVCDYDWAPDKVKIRVMAVDPAMKKADIQKSDPDYFAIAVVDYFPRKYCWKVLSVYHERCNFPTQVERVKSFAQNYNPQYVVIESNFYQAALGQHLIHSTSLPIVQFDQTRDKVERITELTPYFQNHQIFFVGAVPSDFKIEYLGFPNIKVKRDMLDALHLAITYSKRINPHKKVIMF